ncbi:hypothetical protein D3C74_267080 [compost metagenome]
MRHAEPLLFVNDQQAQILKDQILRQNPVGPDDDVHCPLANAFDRFVLLFAAAETA